MENAFGRLKGRCRCLLKRLDFKLENVPYIVSACMVLHNMCEMYGDNCLTEWTGHTPPDLCTPVTTTTASGTNGAGIRNAIMQHLSSTKLSVHHQHVFNSIFFFIISIGGRERIRMREM